MFGKDKETPAGNDRDARPPLMPSEVVRQQPPRPAAAPAPTSPASAVAAQPDKASSISAGMTIFGKVIGSGDVKVFGRIEGELQASNVQICEGAQVEGNIVAEQLSIGGRVKGTIHAARVRLQSTADVDGDIFHRSLAIEENARFEGTSRRENSGDRASVGQATSAQTQTQPSSAPPTLPPAAPTEPNGKYNGAADRPRPTGG